MARNIGQKKQFIGKKSKAALNKRAGELLGFALIAIGIMISIALLTYSPNDPSLFSETSGPVQNKLGEFGATVSSYTFITVGVASWCLPFSFIIWGIRKVIHIGEERWVWRIIFIPIFISITAIFLAAYADVISLKQNWPLGGIAGDAIILLFKDMGWINTVFSLNFSAIILLILTLFIGFYALGFSFYEVKVIIKGIIYAIIMLYSGLLNIFLNIFSMGQKVINSTQEKITKSLTLRNERRVIQNAQISTSTQTPEVIPPPGQQKPTKSLLKVNPNFLDSQYNDDDQNLIDPIDEGKDSAAIRIQNRISEVIKNRKKPIDIPKTPENKISAAVARVNMRREPHLQTPTNTEPINPIIKPLPSNNLPPLNSLPHLSVKNTSVVEPPNKKPILQSKKAKEEAQPNLFSEKISVNFETPALNFLSNPTRVMREQLSNEALEENARMLENVLDDYGVKGNIVSVRPGPVVTMYELEPAPGLKASRVIGLSDDIARSMSALAARVSTVPGRTIIGIELPNDTRETVFLREILSARDYGDGTHSLPLALGKDIGGDPIITDLAKMPHLLIAGTTGSGKSVAINTMILSLLYKLSPDECRLIMIDPKMLELSVYDGIPHLLSPVVTDPKKAVVALKWVVGEMEERYRKMSKMGVRSIKGYNDRVQDALAKGEDFERTVQTGFAQDTGEPVFETEIITPEKLPYIVVIVDEMADLMMVAGKEIEACIQRLAQMARASGIHLIMATQRPSVDVITGTIKANFPTRISFQVTSKIDSRTILGEMGAEQLLGMGDMLYMEGGGKIIRIHAPFVSDEEVETVVNHLKSYGPPVYVSGVVKPPPNSKGGTSIDEVLGLGGNTNSENALYDEAVQIVARDRKCSTSYIQRRLSIGYNKAAKLVEEMEENGIVSSANHVGKRNILLPEN